jgi:hypothetical protein
MRHVFVLLAGLISLTAFAADKWDFEDAKVNWTPRSATVKLERATTGAHGGAGCLRVSGSEPGNWNYAASSRLPMVPGQAYRLSAWMKLNALPEGTAAPSLKCEFVATDAAKDGGRVTTSAYETSKLGQWQELTAQFVAPAGIAFYWLAIEKGGNTPMAIDLLLDDVTVETIDKVNLTEPYALKPFPARLTQLRGVHPRIYLDQAKVAALREAIKTTHAAIWAKLQGQADALVKKGPPKYLEIDPYSGDEQLYQREVGNAMPTVALAWLMTGDQKYLDSARAWALMSCSYPTWGLKGIDGMDLATGHQLLGLGLVYDWCYNGLSEADRKTIRETLIKRAGNMCEKAAMGQAWWKQSYMQNHLWVNTAGMAVAGFAVYDEVPEADAWIGLPLDKFKRTMEALGGDGASHEGVGYWQYGAEYMLKFMWLARDLLSVEMFDSDWWRNTSKYALYMELPRNAWTGRSSIVDIADCPRSNWYGPDYMLRLLAQEYNDPYAQWLADEVNVANIAAAGAPWLNLLWYDPAIKAKAPADLPTLRHFEDMDIVSARSDWSGNESLLVFKCGPFIGHDAVQKFSYDPGGGHVHPDANHFLLFGEGEWLIRDDGYASKRTGQHNTLLIDGKGQMGEAHWFNGALMLGRKEQPKIVKAASQPGMDYLIGDATAAYPAQSGVKRFRRHLLFVKPNVLLVLDDIAMDQARPLELRFHPEVQKSMAEGNGFVSKGEKASLRIEPLTLEGVKATAEMVDGESREAKPLPMYTVRLQANKASWRNATALTWCGAGEEPAEVTLRQNGDEWTFVGKGWQVSFVWGKDGAELRK